MNNANKILSVLSFFTMSASICMVRPTSLPSPDPMGFRKRPVEVPSLLELAVEEVFQQVEGYIKNYAGQHVDPAIAATELFERYVPENYFDDCLKKRFVSEYAIKLYSHVGRGRVSLYDGRRMTLRKLRLNPTTVRLKNDSPLNLLNSHDLVTLLIRVERAKLAHELYPN